MIERYPEGSPAIPYPHKIIHWSSGTTPTLQIDVPPSQREHGAPAIPGWTPFFVSFFGYDRPFMHYSYKPEPVSLSER